MSIVERERDQVAGHLAAAFATPKVIPYPFKPEVRVRFIRGDNEATPDYPFKVEFVCGRETLSTWFNFQVFNNWKRDESYGLAIQNPLKKSAKFSRLVVRIEATAGARRHVAGGELFRLTTAELPDPEQVRGLLTQLGHAGDDPDKPYLLRQCREPFDVLQAQGLVPPMLEFLGFTLALMCFRLTDKKRGIRFREIPSLRLLAVIGDALDNWSSASK